jgi:expansin (peptidoglycan-binding protein)
VTETVAREPDSEAHAPMRALPILLLFALGCGDDGGGGDDSGPVDGGPVVPGMCEAPSDHEGEGTYYTFADGSGNCGFPATPDDLMVGAMNDSDYADSAVCGSCARVSGPDGTVTVRIVDRCPECPAGDIDLSPEAFERIAPLSAGRVPIQWTYVACEVSGPVVYHFKDGSNQWWTAVQLRNHRHAIARFEYQDDGGDFVEVPRVDYNYFVQESGMGPGPFTFRVTDVHGNVLTDRGIPLLDDGDADGARQFPPCE